MLSNAKSYLILIFDSDIKIQNKHCESRTPNKDKEVVSMQNKEISIVQAI